MAEEAKINIKVDTSEVSNLKKELRGLVNELNNLEPGSERFQELASRAGQLRDQIQDTQAVVNGLAGNAIENLAGAFGKAASVGINAFQGITGAQAMFGSDSEELMELMAKLQGAMAMSEAIKGLGALGDTFTEIKAGVTGAVTKFMAWRAAKIANLTTDAALTTATGVQTAATVGQTAATGGATIATKLLGAAMKALPIVAIIAGITAIVGAIYSMVDANDEAAKKQEELNRLKRVEKMLNDQSVKDLDKYTSVIIDNYNFKVALMQAEGKTAKEISAVKIEGYETELRSLELTRMSGVKLSKEQRDRIIELQRLIKIEQATVATAERERTKVQKEEAKKRRDEANKLAEDEWLKIRAINTQRAEEYAKTEEEKTKKLEEELNKRVQAEIDAGIEMRNAAAEGIDEFEQQQEDYKKGYKNIGKTRRQILKQEYEDETKENERLKSERLISHEDYVNKKTDLDKKYNQELLQMNLETAGQIAGKASEIITGITSTIGDILNTQAEAASIKRQEQYNAESEALKASLDNRAITQSEFEAKMAALDQEKAQKELVAKRKDFKQDKNLRIAQANMSAAQAIISAFASGGNPIVGAIFAAITAAATGVQLGIIASQEFRAAKGGVVPGNGPGHIDSVPSLLAPGEMVINANSSKMFSSILSDINMAGGGNQLAPSVPNGGRLQATSFGNTQTTQVVQAYVVDKQSNDVRMMAERLERANKF